MIEHLYRSRILVGDPHTRSSLHATFVAYGAEVTDVASGRELLQALVQRGPFDAVVSDTALSDPSCPDIIGMTRGLAFLVVSHASDRYEICRSGAIEVVRDPADDEVVVTALEQLLARAAPASWLELRHRVAVGLGRKSHLVTLEHAVQRLAVDLEDMRGMRPDPVARVEDAQDVFSLDLVERR